MLELQMQEMRDLPERLTSLESQNVLLRHETSSEVSAIRHRLKSDIDETRAFTRVLYEDVLARLKMIEEKAMTRTIDTAQPQRPRLRSPEEMEELFRQIVARDPVEGPRIVEVHKQIIALLDAMIDKQRRRAG